MTELRPYERFDLWWDANGAHIETLIVANDYPRKWAVSQQGPLRAWIINHPEKRFTERGWKARVGHWLSNGWYGQYMDDEKRRDIRQRERAGGGVDYTRPPEV